MNSDLKEINESLGKSTVEEVEKVEAEVPKKKAKKQVE